MKKCLKAIFFLIVLVLCAFGFVSSVYAEDTITRKPKLPEYEGFITKKDKPTEYRPFITKAISRIITSFTCNLSLVNGTAFISNPSVDLHSYVGFEITLNDGSQNLVGWIKAAGTGETLGSELITNGGFNSDTSGWADGGDCTIASVAGGQSGNGCELTRLSGSDQTFWTSPSVKNAYSQTEDALYVHSIYVKSGTSGNGAYKTFQYVIGAGDQIIITGTTTSSWVQSTPKYYTFDNEHNDSGVIGFRKDNASVGTMLVDSISTKQVLTPSATGVRIVSVRGGGTYNWTSDGGINPNATNFTVTLRKPIDLFKE